MVERIIPYPGVPDAAQKGLHVADLAPGVTKAALRAATGATIIG